jgi:hypothetical protein
MNVPLRIHVLESVASLSVVYTGQRLAITLHEVRRGKRVAVYRVDGVETPLDQVPDDDYSAAVVEITRRYWALSERVTRRDLGGGWSIQRVS